MFYWNLLSYWHSYDFGVGRVKKFQSLFYWNLLSYQPNFGNKTFVITFQSLFYWNLLSYLEGVRDKFSVVRFQSLFYWNLLSYIRSQPKMSCLFEVSILVLLEPPLILACRRSSNIRRRVSILVLLEPPLILEGNTAALSRYGSFNPCFTGTSSHTNLIMGQARLLLVSILVLLEPPLIQKSNGEKRSGFLFQSLFYWNLLSYKNLAL